MVFNGMPDLYYARSVLGRKEDELIRIHTKQLSQ